MTRIRIIEWLIAAIVIVVAHGVAVSAWLWLVPTGPSGVVLPQAPVAETKTPAADAIALSVKITGLEPQAPLVAAKPPSGTVTGPVAADKDNSQVPKAGDDEEVITTVVSAAPIKQRDKNAGPQPPGQNEVLPSSTLEIIKLASPDAEIDTDTDSDSDVETEKTASIGSPTTIKDPVPVPKVKPSSGSITNGTSSDDTATGENQVASVSPSTPEADPESQVPSAAQTTYYRQLLAALKDKRIYPSAARREGKVGTVYMQIVVKNDGAISSYEIVRSSGHPILDEAAVETLREASPLSEFPAGIPNKELKFGVPIRYP